MVICCAKADATTIRPVVDDFESQGHMVVLLDGVETSPEQLAPTVERLHGEGLYVLCRSKALGRAAVDELRDILLAHHVPFGRTLTVASTRPRELRERIAASLRRLATGNARRLSTVSPDGAPKKTRLGIAAPPSPPPTSDESDFEHEEATDVRPRLPKTTRLGMAGPSVPPPPKTTTPEPEPTADDAEPPARLTPAIEPEPVPEPISSEQVSAAVTISADELSDLDAELPVSEPPPPPVRTGNTTVARVLEPSQLEAIRTGDTAIVSREALLAAGLDEKDLAGPPPSPPPSVAVEQLDPSSGKGPPWMWIGIGGAALALIVIIGIAVSGGDDDAQDDPVAQADAPSKGDDASQDSATQKDSAETVEVEDDAPLPTGDGPTRIGHALRNRSIRSLDVLLVSNTEGPLSWEAAKEHCGGLDLGGLNTWRLPEVGELMSLTRAQMTQRGYYWTQTPADTFGDTPLVWYAKRSRVVTRSRDNLVLCVRGSTGAG